MKRAICLAVLALGCKQAADDRWLERKITTVEIGPFQGQIPSLWRDVSELKDKPQLAQMPAGARVLSVEKQERDFQANIFLEWLDASVYASLTCDQVASRMAKAELQREGAAIESKVGADRVCEWDGSHVNARAHLRVRFHADHILYEQCLRLTSGDPIGDAGCNDLWASLKLK